MDRLSSSNNASLIDCEIDFVALALHVTGTPEPGGDVLPFMRVTPPLPPEIRWAASSVIRRLARALAESAGMRCPLREGCDQPDGLRILRALLVHLYRLRDDETYELIMEVDPSDDANWYGKEGWIEDVGRWAADADRDGRAE